LISLSSNIRSSEGVVVLFCLTQKTCVSASLFTIGHTLTFNRVVRPTLVNRILVNRKWVKFWFLSLPILEIMEGIVILFRLKQKTGVSASFFTIGHTLTFNCVLQPTLVSQILVNRKGVKFWFLGLLIFETLRALWFCFVCHKILVYRLVYLRSDTLMFNRVLRPMLVN